MQLKERNTSEVAGITLPKSMLKGLIGAFIITFATFVCFALIITFTGVSEAYADIMVTAATYVAIAAGGYLAAKGAGGKGWLIGAVSGLIYMLLVWIAGCISRTGMYFSASMASSMAISALCGAIGGIIGINIKN